MNYIAPPIATMLFVLRDNYKIVFEFSPIQERILFPYELQYPYLWNRKMVASYLEKR